MVVISQDRVDDVYDHVRDMCGPTDAQVLIFCNMDCDAICATNILSEVLKNDHIRFAVHPVSSYLDLQAKFSSLVNEQDGPTATFLVNCGANTNLHEFLDLDNCPSGLLVCVVDSHRPFDLANMQEVDEDEGSNYKLFLIDSDDPDDMQAPDTSVLAEMSSASEDSSDDDDSDLESTEEEDEEENDDEEAVRQRQRRRTSDEGGSADDGSDSEAEAKRHRKRKRNRKRRQRQLEHEIKQYYSVTYFGATSSSYMWQLAAQLDQKTNKLLWWNIVALTDYYVQERYTGDKYQEKVEELQNEVGRLNLDPDSLAYDDDGNELDRSGKPEVERIAFSEELRFMLPKHWTLYDSMMHSSYVASRLGIWKETGKFKFDTLLAKMGIPLKVCKQQYSHMGPEYKKLLELKLPEYAEEFGLTEITYGSFEKLNGFRQRLSAADVVYSINALLEEDDKTLDEKGREESIQLGTAVTNANFWNAYQALQNLPHSNALLHRGFKIAIEVQQVVFQQGKIVIDKNQINDCGRNFQWITMAESVDAQIFSKPMGLGKLALFLSSALRKPKKRTSKIKPLVVATFVPARDMYLVVGVTGAPRVGESSMMHNRFGQMFRQAANETRAQVKHDGFDLSCIEIRKEDLRKVYDYLSINDS